MTDELRSCPFCGNNYKVMKLIEDVYYVECLNCGYEILHKDWQSRPIESALEAQVKDMQAEIDRLIELQRIMPLVADRRGAELSDMHSRLKEAVGEINRMLAKCNPEEHIWQYHTMKLTLSIILQYFPEELKEE
jgi:Zn ribbon nucleic-acid-binding protein